MDDRRESPRAPAWRRSAAWAGALVLGCVLLLAAWGKALDPQAFAEQITAEGLDFLVPAHWLAWLVVVAEVALGLALLVGLRLRGVLIPTGVLITVFVFLTSRAYWRWTHGIEPAGSECGCFGNLVARSPAEAFWQDMLLLVPPYVLCWLDTTGARGVHSLWRWLLVSAAVATAGAFTVLSPGLPLDDLATRLSPGTKTAEVCAGSQKDEGERVCLDLLVPELQDGEHLVVLDSLDSETLQSAFDDLNALVGTEGRGVWLLVDADEEQMQLFFWEWGPLFEVRETPASLLRPLYRTLPRSFLVDDGVVVRTWTGMPDFSS